MWEYVPSVFLRPQLSYCTSYLLVQLHHLLLGLGDDALQLMKASLHLSEAQAGVLLISTDSLQLLLAVLLGNAGALLPLLDTLREDLINPTEGSIHSAHKGLSQS